MLKSKGVSFPIQLNRRDDLAQGTGEEQEIVDLTLLFGIQKGECPWDGNLGTSFRKLKHAKMSTAISRAVVVRDSADQVSRYSPAFVVTKGTTGKVGSSLKISIEVAPRVNIEQRRTIETEV